MFIDKNQSICVLYSQNLQKQNPKYFQTERGGGGEGARPARRSWIRLCLYTKTATLLVFGLISKIFIKLYHS